MEVQSAGSLSPLSFATLRTRLIGSLLLWAMYVTYNYYLYSGWDVSEQLTWGFTIKDTVAAVASYYFFSWVVLPQLLLRRRWMLTVLGLAAIYYCWALVSYVFYLGLDATGLITPKFTYAYRILDKGLWVGVFSWYGVSIGLYDFALTIVPLLLLRFVHFLLTSSNQSLRLERENLNLEVNFLKAQINPHFLFNTLNNIYTMVVKQDHRAPNMVAHLSHLMHYTVYESDAALVPLNKEIGFLEAYLELERLRYGQKVSINYQNTAAAAAGHFITPLLFFPFVENAFKHGVDSSLDASWVQISLATQDGQLLFEVENSFSQNAPQREVGGVGIANVKKRLALHYAPQDYQLTITHDPDAHIYRVALTIRLTSAKMPPKVSLAKPAYISS